MGQMCNMPFFSRSDKPTNNSLSQHASTSFQDAGHSCFQQKISLQYTICPSPANSKQTMSQVFKTIRYPLYCIFDSIKSAKAIKRSQFGLYCPT